jgi:2-polyprenyl-6-methoxyphenol hydroxylase-like FAD-dependent oxidoreductase
MAADSEILEVQCCIAGGGPAGMMLGFLLARAGVEVVVLEKHADFFRDFRGDTIHPSTLQVMFELGLLQEFLKRPHQEVKQLAGYIGDLQVTIADFSHLPTHCQFLALMPQWDFLDFIVQEARRYPAFRLRMEAEVKELVQEGDRVVGLRAATPAGLLEVRAALTVGADGRSSTVRRLAKLVVKNIGAPMDVLWMRLSRHESDPVVPMGRFNRGRILAMIYRGDYWQCGFVIPKGGYEAIRERGIENFREEIVAIAPFLKDRVGELRDWDDVKLLTVTVDRLERWCRPGLLCIGDAAHAMSPVGGVGINLAIQDAVATANLLAMPLRNGTVTTNDLEKVQQRRELPTRLTQRVQVYVQDHVIGHVLSTRKAISPPLPVRMLKRWPLLRRIPARLVGMGFRPEHVHTPDILA